MMVKRNLLCANCVHLLKLTWMRWNTELVTRYTCEAKSNPCTLTAFCCILNVHRISAGTAFAFSKKIDLYKQDLYDLGMNFVFSFICLPIQRRL